MTSAAPLCATASASSGTVALSPKSSAFKGSRTAARSFVGVAGALTMGTRAAARVAQATSSSWGNLLPCLLSDETRAGDGAALHIAPSDSCRNRPATLCEAAGKLLSMWKASKAELVDRHTSFKTRSLLCS